MDRLMDAYHAQDLTTMAKLYEEDDADNPAQALRKKKMNSTKSAIKYGWRNFLK